MWRVTLRSKFPFANGNVLQIPSLCIKKRLFLSEAYKCQETWERRLQAPIFQNIKLDELFQDLDKKFQHTGKASAIDIDLFANAIKEESHLEELEDLIHRLRLSPNTSDTLPSTSHSVIRSFLSCGKHSDLLRILDDRLNYGIFPDYYCSRLLMDTFLKENNYTGAAKVGVLQMLQEDWSDPVTSHLALYSCHMYLKNPGPWEDSIEAEEPDDGEEVKVRVKYLRNPYFDDHFDLRDPKLLVGKTLATLGSTLPDAVGQTYQLLGWGMYQKWDKAVATLEQFLREKHKPTMFKEGVEMFKECLKELPQEEENSKEINNKLLGLLSDLESSNLLTGDDLHEAVTTKVKQIVNVKESEAIEEQKKVYSEWEKLRERLLQEQYDELIKQQRLEKVKFEKEQLAKKENVLFFFDNEEKWELAIEKKVLQQQRMMRKQKAKKTSDSEYIPPEVSSKKV